MITRFSVLPSGIILGLDKQGIFEKGIVYEVSFCLGQIIFKPLGEMALPAKGYPSAKSTPNDILMCGNVHIVTKSEYNEINKDID